MSGFINDNVTVGMLRSAMKARLSLRVLNSLQKLACWDLVYRVASLEEVSLVVVVVHMVVEWKEAVSVVRHASTSPCFW